MKTDLQKANQVIARLKKIPSLYSGKKLTPEETKGMVEKLTIKPAGASYKMHKITQEEKIDLKKYLDGLDELIAKRPKDIELRKYREMVIKKLDEI